jgi:hypothetical protein
VEENVLSGGHKILKLRANRRDRFKKVTPINYAWYLDAEFFVKALEYR